MTYFCPDVHPDDAFSKVPYEKGSTFLWYLEGIVGEQKMEEFLRFYYKKFALKSIDSDDFKQTFMDYFKEIDYTIYPVEGEWEYFLPNSENMSKHFLKGLGIKFRCPEGQPIDFIEDD